MGVPGLSFRPPAGAISWLVPGDGVSERPLGAIQLTPFVKLTTRPWRKWFAVGVQDYWADGWRRRFAFISGWARYEAPGVPWAGWSWQEAGWPPEGSPRGEAVDSEEVPANVRVLLERDLERLREVARPMIRGTRRKTPGWWV